MKKILIAILLLFFMSTGIMAQENKNIEVIEDDEFLYERSSLNLQGFRARGAIGPRLGLLSLDLDEINDILAEEDSDLAEFENQMIISGGSIIGGFREGPRFGILAMSGEQEVSNGNGKAANFEISYGGLVSEYALYAGSRYDVALGAMLGGGNINLAIRHEEAEDLESGIESPKGTNANKDFFVFKPRANFHYKLTPYLALDLDTAYLITHNSNEKWDIMGTEVKDTTDNLHGPTLTVKLNFGF